VTLAISIPDIDPVGKHMITCTDGQHFHDVLSTLSGYDCAVRGGVLQGADVTVRVSGSAAAAAWAEFDSPWHMRPNSWEVSLAHQAFRNAARPPRRERSDLAGILLDI
jgi:hypothetical protein